MCNIRDVREQVLQPQRSYMWDISILGQRIITHGLSDRKLEDVSMYAISVNIPQRSREPIKISRLDSSVNFSGKNNAPKTITINFFDDESLEIYEYMEAWLNATATQGREKFVRDIEIKLKDVTDQVVTGRIRMSGCFPIEIAEHQLNYSESGIIEQQITFIFDEIIPINDGKHSGTQAPKKMPRTEYISQSKAATNFVIADSENNKELDRLVVAKSANPSEQPSLSDRIYNNKEYENAFSHKTSQTTITDSSGDIQQAKFRKLTPTTTPLFLRITNPIETGFALISKGGNPLKGVKINVGKLTAGLISSTGKVDVENFGVNIARRIGAKTAERLSTAVDSAALNRLESQVKVR